MGEDQPGVTNTLKIENSEGEIKDIELTKDWITVHTILFYEILELGEFKIGYLVFNQFLSISVAELNAVFALFKQNGINELILDLRYNGGGYLYVAQHLASLIGGNRVKDQLFFKYMHNDKLRDWDRSIYFTAPDYALNLNRVFVITTPSSCSASESVINGLAPYLDVIRIGTQTCGKPVGMYGHDFCDKHINAVEFKTVNADNYGDYFDGIFPHCYASDGLDMPFGDVREDSLVEALTVILTGACLNQNRDARSTVSQREIELDGFRREIGAF